LGRPPDGMSTAARAYRTFVPSTPAVLAAGGVGVAVGVGTMVDVRAGVALAFAVLGVAMALRDLPTMIGAWAALTVFSRHPAFSTVASAAGLLVLGGWVAQMRTEPAALRAGLYLHRRLLSIVALLILWLTLSVLWSHDTGAATAELVAWYINAVALVVLLTSVRTPRGVRLVIVGVVLAVTAAVVLALAGVDLSTHSAADVGARSEGRLQGVIGDPNFMAAFIVPALALCAALRSIVSPPARAILVLAAVVLVVGLVATVSRGGMLAALVAFITAVVLMRGRRPTVLGVGAVALAIAALWFSSNPAAIERYRSAEEDRGSGREDIWLVAGRVAANNPVTGVGLANFTVRSREYVRRPGTLEYVELIVDRPHVVHNTYLQMLAETGAVGLALFLTIAGMAVAAAIRAARRFARLGEPVFANVSRAVAVAQVGLLTAAFFISLQATATVWILLALGPILLGITQPRNSIPGAPKRAVRSSASPPRPRPKPVTAGSKATLG
jgi:O-antigen ligase